MTTRVSLPRVRDCTPSSCPARNESQPNVSRASRSMRGRATARGIGIAYPRAPALKTRRLGRALDPLEPALRAVHRLEREHHRRPEHHPDRPEVAGPAGQPDTDQEEVEDDELAGRVAQRAAASQRA